MAVSPVLSLENPLGVGLTATSNFNRDRDYAAIEDRVTPMITALAS